ncbi:MAG TPA: flagellar basal body P-ring formation chaperone FlgA [Patescibacteria group bacterium]|nr:flagellar basal body P-ring formation chaperone FlgA [Patescibacteria group bacterium]
MKNPALIFDLAFRIAVLFLALTIGVVILFAGARKAMAAEPRAITTVTSDTLRAGDVFSGLTPDQAEYVLGTPPTPGKDMVLDAHILRRIAQAIDLNWQPKSPAEKVIVRRAATIVGDADIRSALTKELRARGVDGKFNVTFSDSASPQIILPESQPGTVAVKELRFEPGKDWFEAVLVAPSEKNPVTQLPVAGRIQRLVQVPVLHSTLRNGDIIGKADVEMIDIPSDDVQAGMILKAENLVGMTPSRFMQAGKPVRDNEVRRPQVISRGDFITLIYASGPMTLTTKGKATQDAAMGDIVHAVNISSSRTVQGIASGDHEITISE